MINNDQRYASTQLNTEQDDCRGELNNEWTVPAVCLAVVLLVESLLYSYSVRLYNQASLKEITASFICEGL